jgi:hypothetical protein
MPDWPPDNLAYGAYGLLSTAGEGCPAGEAFSNMGGVFTSTLAWPTANLAIFTAIVVRNRVTIFQMGWLNGATLGNDIDVGVYDRNLNKVISTGATAQSGTSVAQFVDITDTPLDAGLYYMAMSSNQSAAGIVAKGSTSTAASVTCRALGSFQMASAHPLPTTATVAAHASTMPVPLIMASLTATI